MATQDRAAASGKVGTEEAILTTQNTQYDAIGSKYGDIKVKPAVQPERPSVEAVLGDVRGKRCLGGFFPPILLLSSSLLRVYSVVRFDVAPCSSHYLIYFCVHV